MFKKNFEIVEIRVESGVTVKHYFHETKKELQKIIDDVKEKSNRYEIMGKEAMVAWF